MRSEPRIRDLIRIEVGVESCVLARGANDLDASSGWGCESVADTDHVAVAGSARGLGIDDSHVVTEGDVAKLEHRASLADPADATTGNK